jgi:hypothetical protein
MASARRSATTDPGAGTRCTLTTLFGADGGRLVPRLIGVEYEGLGVITQMVTLHVSADFSRWAKDPDVLTRWIFSPQARRPGRDGSDGTGALGP